MTSLDWGSARSRDLYLTTHNIHKRRISMPQAGFEPAVPSKWADTRVLLRPRGHRDRRIYSFVALSHCCLFGDIYRAFTSRDSETFCAFWPMTLRKYILNDINLWQCERPHSVIGIRSVGRTYKLTRRLRVCGPWTVLLTGRPVERDSIVGGEFLLLRKLQDPPSIPRGGGG